jgi:hypothetical protein
MIPTSIMVGVSHGSFLTLYKAGTDAFCERQNKVGLGYDEWKQRREKGGNAFRKNIVTQLDAAYHLR